ncbi:MAG: hypothetical protein WBL20_17770 [Sphingobium sp.]|uniref:hypothetical protein n=1 Tax=Sphingobium sp. TaxID=1912891 RepID=UPI003BB1AFF6
MANRVSASIELGGSLTATDYIELSEIIASEGLSIEWDGEPFEPAHRVAGARLSLYAHEVAWGRFEKLETWCVEKRLVFARWSGAYAGEWGAERVVFTGDGAPVSFAADEDDTVVINRGTVEKLASLDAIIAYFDAADVRVPPLVVEGDPNEVPSAQISNPTPPPKSAYPSRISACWIG